MEDQTDHTHLPSSSIHQAEPAFAGREPALAALYRTLNNPHPRQALLYIGQHLAGKTTLLRHIDRVLNEGQDEQYLVVFLPLDTALGSDESLLLQTLYGLAYDRLLAAGFSENRLPGQPTEPRQPASQVSWRSWLQETGLPGLLNVLRGGRRLIILLDDADLLLDGIENGHLPEDLPVYLQQLLRPQCYLVLTVDLAHEDRLARLTPLVNPAEAHRLRWLTADELFDLFPGPDLDLVRQVVSRIHHQTGGQPMLAQHYRSALQAQVTASHAASPAITPQDVETVTPAVYSASTGFYRELLASLSGTEHLTLSAIVSLRYAAPLKPVTAVQVNSWLAETDYHLDLTAINAAIRSLEYRELLAVDQGAVTPTAEFLQKWLLENIDLPRTLPQRPLDLTPASRRITAQMRYLWMAALIVGAALLLVLLLLFQDQPSSTPLTNIPPTVTLQQGGALTP